MTVSVGTFDDLRGDRPQPVDRNPTVECSGCGTSENWQTVAGDDSDWKPPESPDDPILCPECREEPIGVKSVEERREENHQLAEFVERGEPGV